MRQTILVSTFTIIRRTIIIIIIIISIIKPIYVFVIYGRTFQGAMFTDISVNFFYARILFQVHLRFLSDRFWEKATHSTHRARNFKI